MMDDMSLADQLRWQYSGDLNDKHTRQKVADTLSAYIEELKYSGAACRRFVVICDETNNPPDVVAKGQLQVNIFMSDPDEKMIREMDKTGIPYVWTKSD